VIDDSRRAVAARSSRHALGGKTGTSPSLPASASAVRRCRRLRAGVCPDGDPRLPPPEEVERGVGGEGAHALHAWVGCEAANQLAVGDDLPTQAGVS